MNNKDLEKIDNALFSRAIGFSQDEITEEFAMVENELTLIKKKRNVKYYPPELKAIEMLMGKYAITNDNMYKDYSLEQLTEEKESLLKQLKEAEEKQIANDRKSKKKS